MIGRKKGSKLGFRREQSFTYRTKKLAPDLVTVSAPIYIGTRYFVAYDNGQAGNEIGFSKMRWDSHDDLQIPFPPEMWFCTEMLNSLVQCECVSHGERGCKYYYPGWSYNTDSQLSLEFDVIRFEAASGRFWLWVLDGQRDEENHREFGKWKD
jgi:hypothetical protein